MSGKYSSISITPTDNGHLVHVNHEPDAAGVPRNDPPKHFSNPEEAGAHVNQVLSGHNKAVEAHKQRTSPWSETIPHDVHPIQQMRQRPYVPPVSNGG